MDLTKLGKINVKYLYLLSTILIIIPLVKPIGLPLSVRPMTEQYLEVLTSLEEGSIIVWNDMSRPETWDVQKPIQVVTMKVIFSRGHKLIIFCGLASSPILFQKVIDVVDPEKNYGAKYGEDYVLFGYVPGDEIAISSFATNMKATVSLDYYGNKIEDLPLMENINTAEDADLLIQLGRTEQAYDWAMRQWIIPYGTKYIVMGNEASIPTIKIYVPHLINAYVAGIGQAAELEYITGFSGDALKNSDANNLALLPLYAFIVLANIAHFAGKSRAREIVEE